MATVMVSYTAYTYGVHNPFLAPNFSEVAPADQGRCNATCASATDTNQRPDHWACSKAKRRPAEMIVAFDVPIHAGIAGSDRRDARGRQPYVPGDGTGEAIQRRRVRQLVPRDLQRGKPAEALHVARSTEAAATRLADRSVTTTQLMVWFGWKTASESERYTRNADRKRAAASAGKLITGTEIGKSEIQFAKTETK